MGHADPPGPVPGLDDVRAYLGTCVADGLLPSAAVEIGDARGSRGRVAIGAPVDAVYDLASLTKVLGTGLVATHLVATARLELDSRVSAWLSEWRRADRAFVLVRDLLSHASGLPAYLPMFATHRGADAIAGASADATLAAPPRSQAIYSDVGFIVAGRVLERAGGASLATQTAALLQRVTARPPGFGPTARGEPVQPTGWSAWRGRTVSGEVHDDNAAAMGGVAGHAGLFGTVEGVGDLARAVLRGLRGADTPLAPAWAMRAFARRSPVPGSSRALAWDTALPSSSCGPQWSRCAIGHTGFTGTSVWIDPLLNLYVVLLTNRVAGEATLADMARIRRDVHQRVGAAWRGAVA